MPAAPGVETKGLDRFRREADAVGKGARTALKKKMTKGIKSIAKLAKTRVASKRIRRAFKTTVRKRGNFFEAITGTRVRMAFFAHFHELGTKPSASPHHRFRTRAFRWMEAAVRQLGEGVIRSLPDAYSLSATRRRK